ncbi:MAG TPA: cysteine hydrolase [Alphaproteobacteria bacterium]|nr:cysteine hydrolase [Alphaproteobacteria bacterium]
MLNFHRYAGLSVIATAATVVAVVTCMAMSARAETIIDEWSSVKMPPAPQLKPAKIDPKTTAFLSLDLVKGTCNNERRPRCLQTIPVVAKLLDEARAKGVAVVHSLPSSATPEDFVSQVAPKSGEPIVKASVDKFLNTDLDKILKEKGIKTVIIVGTTAEGAVLFTATEAAVRGYNVVVPVEGSTAASTYAESAVAWMIANAPGISQKATLTKADMITY